MNRANQQGIVFVMSVVVGTMTLIGVAAYTFHRLQWSQRNINLAMAPVAAALVAAVLWLTMRWDRRHLKGRVSRPDEATLRQRRTSARAELEAALAGLPRRDLYLALWDRGAAFTVADVGARERRLDEIAGDPKKAVFADRILSGETVTDAMIAYALDAQQLALCDHLRPIERDLRAVDPDAALQANGSVVATRRFGLDVSRLHDRYQLPPWVVFAEDASREVDRAWLSCRQCSCAIEWLPTFVQGERFPLDPRPHA